MRKYTILLLLTATSAWLKLSRAERGDFNERVVTPIFAKYAASLSVRWFDAEAFNARHSDFALIETTDLSDYYHLIEDLRDTPLFSQPYFQLNEVIMGLEDGYQEIEG